MFENKKVKKGDVLAIIRGDKIDLQMNRFEERISEVNAFIEDLNFLLDLGTASNLVNVKLNTSIYQTSYLKFKTQIQNQDLVLKKRKRDFERAKILYENKSIAFVDYDEIEVQYRQAESQLELIQKNQFNEWEQELRRYSDEKNQLKNQFEIAKEELDQYEIVAGVSGALLNVSNLSIGDFVYPNQKLAEISPDSTLMAVTFISPTDIGFIKKGQEVIFQVDAYNYNEWGVLKGSVNSISDDLTLLNESRAAYMVTCTLDSDFLKLPSGQQAKIKKGMTFNSRYVVANRSLFQLLYDQVDDWLNPMVN
ncbi:HlyD family efflux transporter periplasmic adaptor subunit [Algoriphagus halophilus]|uniref:HlyD family secretion protein n=1 Tax=Algoriphagus halophilus TaxID=226505 RepID=UPI00358EFD73